jgi:hypothetical protein
MSRSILSKSIPSLVVLSLLAALLIGCGESRPVWRDQKLPSGRQVKVTFMTLAWGVEHDERRPEQDAFTLWYVTNLPEGAPPEREREAREVFELIRPISEQWGFKSATLSAYRTPQRERTYDLYIFNRDDDGRWQCTPSDIGHARSARAVEPD